MTISYWALLLLSLALTLGLLIGLPLRQARLKQRKKYRLFVLTYQNMNGFALSQQARQQHPPDSAFTYGEIDFWGFHALLSLVHPKEEDIFIDLGSGIGKAVICACLNYPMQKYQGIECLEPLHNAALQAKQALLNNPAPDISNKARLISFIHGDLFMQNLGDAGIVFVNATGFFGLHLERLIARLVSCRQGARIIITSKKLPSEFFKLTHQTLAPMSWGAASVFIYLRR